MERITTTNNDEIEAKKASAINDFDFIAIAEREKEYFFTTGELSRLLNVQPAHIGHWAKTGKLRPVPKEKVPKWYDENFKKYSGNLFSSKDIVEFLKNNYKYRKIAKINIMAIAANKISLFDVWTAVTL